jgi:4-hydroxy-2-oxoheptanedioate aldolase
MQAPPANRPKRINRAIALLEQNQPVYYAQISAGGYADGRRLSATKADYILYDMEHGTFDVHELRLFMRGLVDAGPTRTGHRTPPVIVTLPALGDDPVSMRANSWQVQQVLAAGVHGILLCQAESPEAVQIFVEASRYPFAPGVDRAQSHRGSGSQSYASQVWGVSQNEYLRLADTWPLNPEGEIMLGIKIENPKATANSEALTRIKGLAFAEWGPGDQAFYLLGRPGSPSNPEGQNSGQAPSMVQTRARVLAASKAAGIRFLNSCSAQDVLNQLRDGVMICTGGDTPAADIGRAFTKRQQPW